MARKRMLQPMIWDDPDLALLTPTERLLFIGLISFADDYGHVAGNPAVLRKLVFGYDDFTLEQVKTMRDHIVATCHNVELYQVEGQEYLWLKTWERHQDLRFRGPAQYPCHVCGAFHTAENYKNCAGHSVADDKTPSPLAESSVSATQELRKDFAPNKITLDHVESDQTTSVTPSGNGAKRQRKAQPTARAPNQAFGIFVAYCRGLGIDPSEIPRDKNFSGYMASATALLNAGYTQDEVERCTRDTKAKQFWQDKALHIRHVAQEIAQWKPNSDSPKGARHAANQRSPGGSGPPRPLSEPDDITAKYAHLDG